MLVPTQCRSNVQCWLAPCHQSHYLQNGTHVLVWPKLGPELEVCCSHRKLSENRERPPESSNNAHNVQMDDAKLLWKSPVDAGHVLPNPRTNHDFHQGKEHIKTLHIFTQHYKHDQTCPKTGQFSESIHPFSWLGHAGF